MKKFIFYLLLITGGMMAPLWALLATRWPVIDDPIFYATILKLFSTQFWQGEWYPRWLMNTNEGLGSPVFLFYGPVAFYITSMFQFLSAYDPHGFGRLLLGMQLALVVSGITSYRWFRLHRDDAAAKKAALMYAGFPYLLALIYFYFGLAQLWAIAWFPLLLEASDDVLKHGWRAAGKLAMCYALLCMTHLPSLLVFGWVPWVYIAYNDRRVSRIGAASFAIVLGACLSGIYLWPALANRPNILSSHYIEGKLYYANNFAFLPIVFCIAIILAPLLKLYIDLPTPQRLLPPLIRFWLIVIAVLLFMATPLSLPLWDWIPPLQYLQFPFRFFIAMLPGVVFIASHWLSPQKHNLYTWLAVIGTLAMALATTFAGFKSELPENIATALKGNLITQPEYWVKSFKIVSVSDRWQLPEHYRNASLDITEGSGTASMVAQDPRHIWLKADVNTAVATLVLPRFYFPGWAASSPDIHVGDKDALIAISVPKGSHDITLAIPEFAGESQGRTLSILAALVLIAFFMKPRRA
jgi:hypothetical protein